MKSILTLIVFLISLTNISLGQNKPVFKQQDFPSHGDTIYTIPNVVGLTVYKAEGILRKHKIEIGAIIHFGDNKLDSQIVYRQNPTSLKESGEPNFVRKKQLIDLWVFDPNKTADTLKKPNRKISIGIQNNR